MSEGPDNLVLVYLRRIDEKVDHIADDIRELKTRVGILDQQYPSLSGHLDRFEAHLERIERRLDLLDA